MNYYQILQVSQKSTIKEIKYKYYQLAKLYHPDKNNNISSDKFKSLSEAYTILSNPVKRYNYDIQLEYKKISNFNKHFDFQFKDEELIILHYFYSKIKTSVEFRFLKLLYESLPKNEKNIFNNKYSIIDISLIKYINTCDLYEDYTIYLYRSFNDVYLNICKEIIINTNDYFYHLFITHSDYTIIMKNKIKTYLNIHIETKPNDFIINEYDLYLQKNINIYQFFFENIFTIRLPNSTYEYTIHDFKTYKIKHAGLHNPYLNQRGNIYISHQSNLPYQRLSLLKKITPYKNLFKELFNDDIP